MVVGATRENGFDGVRQAVAGDGDAIGAQFAAILVVIGWEHDGSV